MIDKKSVKNILVIKLRGIGDVILSTVILDNLKKDFPNADIDYLTDPPSIPLLRSLPQIKNVLSFPRSDTFERLKLILKIRSIKYDLVFDFFSNPSTALITFLSGAVYRIGFPYKGRRYAYNYFGPYERGLYHSAVLHLKTLEKVSLSSDSENLHCYIEEAAQKLADDFFAVNQLNNKIVFGISPSGGWPSKKCDPEIFAGIGKRLIQKYNAVILVLWGASDKKDAEIIHDLVPSSILAPSTSIMEMAAFLKKCSIVIANDSGPMHISTAVGTPVLSIHGPTDPKLQGPFGSRHEWILNEELDCIICNLLECPKNHECFRELPIDKILDKVNSLLVKNNLPR